jgi:hypothetical protein
MVELIWLSPSSIAPATDGTQPPAQCRGAAGRGHVDVVENAGRFGECAGVTFLQPQLVEFVEKGQEPGNGITEAARLDKCQFHLLACVIAFQPAQPVFDLVAAAAVEIGLCQAASHPRYKQCEGRVRHVLVVDR